MVDYRECVMIYQILHQAHLQEVGLTQILANHFNGTYGLWMRIEGPHNHMVMALVGSCAKRPLSYKKLKRVYNRNWILHVNREKGNHCTCANVSSIQHKNLNP
jgi:hypothetical protein